MTRFIRRVHCAVALAALYQLDSTALAQLSSAEQSGRFTWQAESSLGVLHGKSHEAVIAAEETIDEDLLEGVVLPAGYKMSELIWRIDDVAILNAGVSAKFDRFKLRVGGWKPVIQSATMDDYDWFNPSLSDWTHWSHYTDTHFSGGSYLAEIGAGVEVFRSRSIGVDLLAGYRKQKLAWRAYGGEFVYSSNPFAPDGFRDDVGSFETGELAIIYSQRYSYPYLGVNVEAQADAWTFSGRVIGSSWVRLRAFDDHIDRQYFERDSKGDMYSAELKVAHGVASNVNIFGKVGYNSHRRQSASVVIQDESGREDAGRSGRHNHQSNEIGFGVEISF